MEVDFALLADGVAQRPDGKLDIFGAGIDTVHAAQVPAMHPQLTLVLRFLISRHEAENEHHVDVILMGDDGTEIGRARGELNPLSSEQLDTVPAGRKIGIQIVLAFANLVFPTFGPYQFVIHWDGNEARPPIALHLAEAAPAPAA